MLKKLSRMFKQGEETGPTKAQRELVEFGQTTTIQTNSDTLSIKANENTVNIKENTGKIEVRGDDCLLRIEKNSGKIVILGTRNNIQIATESFLGKTVDEGTNNRIRLLSKAKPITDDEVRPPKVKVEPIPVWSGHRPKFVGAGTRLGDGEIIEPAKKANMPDEEDPEEYGPEVSDIMSDHGSQEEPENPPANPHVDAHPEEPSEEHEEPDHEPEEDPDEQFDPDYVPPEGGYFDDGFNPQLYMPFNGAYGGVSIGGGAPVIPGQGQTRVGEIMSGMVQSADGRDVRIQKVVASAPGKGAEFDCSICGVEASKADDDAAYMDCKHCYHFSCVAEWLKRQSTCPMCKQNVGIVYRTVKRD